MEEEDLSDQNYYQQASQRNVSHVEKGSNMSASIAESPKVKHRKAAFRAPKIRELNGHEFIFKYFTYPTYCALCKEFLW